MSDRRAALAQRVVEPVETTVGSAAEDPGAARNRTFTNRYEIKYLVEARRLPEIEAGLAGFLEPDRNGQHTGSYFNHSIYFDSPDYRYYSEKHEGDLVRIKPRIRTYRNHLDEGPGAIFLELKGRYDRIVEKRRASIDRGMAERLLASGPLHFDAGLPQGSALGEFHYLAHRFQLAPCVSVLYHRTAFYGAFYPDVRVTFDRVIQCSRTTTLDILDQAYMDTVPANWFIIELKYNEKVPRLLLQRFNSLGLQQATFSKYAVSLERTHEACVAPSRYN